MIIFGGTPLVVAFVASWILPYSIWGTRHLTIVFVPIIVLFADAVVGLGNIKIRTFVLTTLLLFIGYGFLLQMSRQPTEAIWCGLEPLGREMQAEENAPVAVFEDLAAYHLWFAFRHEVNQPQIIKVQDFDGMHEDTAYFLPRGFDEVPKIPSDKLNYDRMWVVYRSAEYDPFSPPLYGLGEEGYEIVDHKAYDFGYQKLNGVLIKKRD